MQRWIEKTKWRIKDWWYEFRHQPFPIQWMTCVYWKEGRFIMCAPTKSPMRYAIKHKIENWSTKAEDLVSTDQI